MLKELRKLICLISVLISFSGCSKKTIIIVKVEKVTEDVKLFSPNCYIKKNNQEMLIREGFLYINNSLEKYFTPQAEGFVVEYVSKSGYTKETVKYKKLEFIQNKNNTVFLFKKEYKIESLNKDSIFLSDDIIIIKNPDVIDF